MNTFESQFFKALQIKALFSNTCLTLVWTACPKPDVSITSNLTDNIDELGRLSTQNQWLRHNVHCGYAERSQHKKLMTSDNTHMWGLWQGQESIWERMVVLHVMKLLGWLAYSLSSMDLQFLIKEPNCNFRESIWKVFSLWLVFEPFNICQVCIYWTFLMVNWQWTPESHCDDFTKMFLTLVLWSVNL